MNNKRVIIIGGGIAGLTSACHLIDAGLDVTLFEAAPKLGGRSYSFKHEKSGDIIDNGQHIMMGCYEETIKLLKKIGSFDKLSIQNELRVVFVSRDSQEHYLHAKSSHYPLNLAKSIFNYNALTLKEKIRVVDLFVDLMTIEEEDILDLSVEDWLKKEHQNENAMKDFWEILAIGTLNSRIKDASAAVFVNILKRMFLDGNEATKIILSEAGLSDLFAIPAKRYIEEKGGNVLTSERVLSVSVNNSSFERIVTSKRVISDAEFLVSAVPLYALSRIMDNNNSFKKIHSTMQYSPILSVNIWLKANVFKEKFYGLLNSKIHWLFNHKSYITLVTSAAFNLVEKSENQIINEIISELSDYFPVFSHDNMLSYKIIKEKRATFIPNSESIMLRLNMINEYDNIFIAGDWTEPFLPSTIETAVISGRKAAERIMEKYSNS